MQPKFVSPLLFTAMILFYFQFSANSNIYQQSPSINIDQAIIDRVNNLKKSNEFVSCKEAKNILGDEMLGAEAVQQVWGVVVDSNTIPEIPFSRDDLKKAISRNEFLILRINNTFDLKPLSIRNMYDVLKIHFAKNNELFLASYVQPKFGKGQIQPRVVYQDYYQKHTPRFSWSLVSKSCLQKSIAENYLTQTHVLVWHALQAFTPQTSPAIYRDAMNALLSQDSVITNLLMREPFCRISTELLFKLSANQLLRHRPVDAFYDMVMYKLVRGEWLYTENRIWTSYMWGFPSNDKYYDPLFVTIGYKPGVGIILGELSTCVGTGPGGTVIMPLRDSLVGVACSRYL